VYHPFFSFLTSLIEIEWNDIRRFAVKPPESLLSRRLHGPKGVSYLETAFGLGVPSLWEKLVCVHVTPDTHVRTPFMERQQTTLGNAARSVMSSETCSIDEAGSPFLLDMRFASVRVIRVRVRVSA